MINDYNASFDKFDQISDDVEYLWKSSMAMVGQKQHRSYNTESRNVRRMGHTRHNTVDQTNDASEELGLTGLSGSFRE